MTVKGRPPVDIGLVENIYCVPYAGLSQNVFSLRLKLDYTITSVTTVFRFVCYLHIVVRC